MSARRNFARCGLFSLLWQSLCFLEREAAVAGYLRSTGTVDRIFAARISASRQNGRNDEDFPKDYWRGSKHDCHGLPLSLSGYASEALQNSRGMSLTQGSILDVPCLVNGLLHRWARRPSSSLTITFPSASSTTLKPLRWKQPPTKTTPQTRWYNSTRPRRVCSLFCVADPLLTRLYR